MTLDTDFMNVIDINEKLSVSASQNNDTFSTQALKELASSVVKVLMHLDGRHGVCREYCEPGKVVIRAKTESYLLLDLGHVVRMYFGDDYFDLHLDIDTPYQRSEQLSGLVAEVITENERNERLYRLDRQS